MCQWLVESNSSKFTSTVILEEEVERAARGAFKWVVGSLNTHFGNEVSVKFVLEQSFAGYLNTGGAEQSKCTGDGHDVAVVLFFHPRQERLRHLLGEIRKVLAVDQEPWTFAESSKSDLHSLCLYTFFQKRCGIIVPFLILISYSVGDHI